MHTEWLDKSITERISWYNNELDSRFDYLSDKEPFQDETLITQSRTMLAGIKERMAVDLQFYSNQGELDDTEQAYYQSIREADRTLSGLEEDRAGWFEKLGLANDLLTGIE